MDSVFSYLNLANVLWILCYIVKDVLLLRIMAVVAMLIIIPHYLFNTHDHVAAWWNLLFITINVTWIILLLLERRPPRLTPDQEKLHRLTFSGCAPRQMLRILDKAKWLTANHDELLVPQGEPLAELLLLVDGNATVKAAGNSIARLGDGDFIGEMSFLSGEVTSAAVIARGTVRYLKRTHADLEQLFQYRSDLAAALRSAIGGNLVEKLSATTNRAPALAASFSPATPASTMSTNFDEQPPV